MKIGLFFGTFNPVHVGHVILANHMVQYTDLDAVWFVVTPHNPFKKKSTLLNDYDRLNLVELALTHYEHLETCDVEFHMKQPNYTADTLVHLSEKFPQHDFALIMGGDNLQSFSKWKNARFIGQHYPLYVYPRPGYDLNADDLKVARVNLVENAPSMEIAATFIRASIKADKDVRPLLDVKVWSEIDRMNFYK